MKYDDLEKTQDLFSNEEAIPSPIANIEMEGVTKDNLSLEKENNKDTKDSKDKKELKEDKNNKKKKSKKSLIMRFKDLSKKKKILLITIIILLILALMLLGLIYLFKEPPKEESEKKEEPVVIIEKENYIYEDGILKFLDENEEEIGTYECQNKDENLCYIVNYNEENTLDYAKNVYEDGNIIPRRSIIYNDNYVFIHDNKENTEEIILYNIAEEKEEDKYKSIKGYSDSNLAILENLDGKFGLIEFNRDSFTNNIDFKYDYIGMLDNNERVVVKEKNKYYIYDTSGKAQSKSLDYEIKNYNDKYIVVNNEGYYIYDYEGKIVTKNKSDFINLLDDYVVLINDKKLYIRDYDNNKYNEDGIKLDNDNYTPVSVFDKDKTLIEEKKAYDIHIENNTIEVKYRNNNKEKSKYINIYEGLVSKDIANLNYFDGNLYFYKDEDKEELIGKYTCTNKNIIEKNTKVLNNCTIATESFYSKNDVEVDESANLGWIPIYNERFVFISDVIDNDKKNIVLYDLKDNKALSKYTSVDAKAYVKESKVTFVNEDEVYILAQNTSNKSQNKSYKYGLIRIGNDVKGAIPFEYESLERMKEYYMAHEVSGTYVLLDNAGQKVTDRYGYKIMDYEGNYLKVKDGDLCYIYDFLGSKITDEGYKDIILYKDYYVIIKDGNKLNIGEYNNSSFELSMDIDVSEYYQNDYEINKTTDGYKIKIKSTNKIYYSDESGYIAEES